MSVKLIPHNDRIYKLEKRVALLEEYLIRLAGRCWEHCGTDFVKELMNEIEDLRTLNENENP